MSKKNIIVAICILSTLIIAFSAIIYFSYPRVIIKGNYEKNINIQLFYDTGSGLNEIESITKTINKSNQTTSFRLPNQYIYTLRIDFGENPGKVNLKSIGIYHLSKWNTYTGNAIDHLLNIQNQTNWSGVKDNIFQFESTMLDPYFLNTTGALGINAGGTMWDVVYALCLRLLILLLLGLGYCIAMLTILKHSQSRKIHIATVFNQLINKLRSLPIMQKIIIYGTSVLLGLFCTVAAGTWKFITPIHTIISIFDFISFSLSCLLFILFWKYNQIRISLKQISKKEWLIYSVIVFVFLFFLFLAYYPAAMTSDSINQWSQVQTGKYNTWHPVAHTILFMWLPAQVWNNPASATILQIIMIATVMGYTCYSLRCWGVSRKIIAIFLLVYAIHPSNQRLAIVLWKDVPYSYAILAFSIMCMWIYFSEGRWIRCKKHLIAFVIVNIGVLFMRHNGIAAYIPTMIALAIAYKQYRRTFIVICATLLIFKSVLTGPVYDALGVYKYNLSFAEAMGIPNNQLSYMISNNGDINEDEFEYLYEIAPIEQWKANYSPISINILKWATDEDGKLYMNPMVIEEDKVKFLSTWANLVRKNFGLAVQSYYHVTKLIWDFEVRYDGTERTFESDKEIAQPILNIKEKAHSKVASYIHWCETSPFKLLTPSVGLAFFLMLLAMGCVFMKEKKKVIPFVPYLFHTLIMMCLMSGGVARYTYVNILGYGTILIFSFIKVENCNESD